MMIHSRYCGFASVADLRLVLSCAVACSGSPSEPGAGALSLQTTRLALTTQRSCLLERTGEVLCWGLGGVTRLAPPDGALHFTAIAGGIDHMCGLTVDSTAYCWGRNAFGQLGDGSLISRDQPARVSGNLKFVSIQAAARATYALDPVGRAYAWGSTLNGALGNGRNSLAEMELNPVPMKTTVRFRSLGWGCGLSIVGSAWCWGTVKPAASIHPEYVAPGDCRGAYYYYYEGKDCLVPTAVATSLRFESVSGCMLTATAQTYCIGDGFHGDLGDGRAGDFTHAISPVLVVGGVQWSALSGRCGISTEGTAYCWGNNAIGQLGIGVVGGLRAQPAAVLTDQRFTAISSNAHTCALTAQDAVWCWGPNDSGQLGPDAPAGPSSIPVLSIPAH